MTALCAVRRATRDDLSAITDIYNEAVINTVATFDTEPKTWEEQVKWFEGHCDKRPIMVAVTDGEVVGWTSLSEWCDRCAYSETAELSIYVRKEHRGKGIGRKLVSAVLDEATKVGLHVVVARIETSNHIVIRLLEQHGFERIGVMREVGRKFGRLLDVVLMQRIF